MSTFNEVGIKLSSIKTSNYDEKDPEEFLDTMTRYDEMHPNELERFVKMQQFKVYANKFKKLFNIDLTRYYQKQLTEKKQMQYDKNYIDSGSSKHVNYMVKIPLRRLMNSCLNSKIHLSKL